MKYKLCTTWQTMWQAFASLTVTRNKIIQGEQSSNEPTLRRTKFNFFCQDIHVLKQLGGFMGDQGKSNLPFIYWSKYKKVWKRIQ